MVCKIQSPEKELRFTRAGQAAIFWLISAIGTAAGITLLATAYYRGVHPNLPHPAWALLPFLLSAGMARLAIHLTRHAYVILTPLGIEVFPFFRPAEGMRLIIWQEVYDAEVDEKTSILTIHHDAEKSSGVHLSLKPIPVDSRTLLAKAVIGRVSRGGTNL